MLSDISFLNKYIDKLSRTKGLDVVLMDKVFNFLRIKVEALERENRQLREEIHKLKKSKRGRNSGLNRRN